MTHVDKELLRGCLEGTTRSIMPEMQRLGIDQRISDATNDIAELIVQCRICRKWTDAEVCDSDLCPRCDEIVNPTLEKPE